MTALQSLSVVIVVAPALAFAIAGAIMLLGRVPSERSLARLAGSSLALSFAAAIAVLMGLLVEGSDRVLVPLGRWFTVGDYGFELTLLVDRLSLPFALLTSALCGIVGRFSAGYLHRDPGHARFFLLLLLFASGMLVLTMAGSIDLLFAGWEIVGLTSLLLIAFFHRRQEPAHNGLRAFAVYRVCDVALLVAAVLIHHYAHSADFDTAFGHGHWPAGLAELSGRPADIVALLLVFAAMGKSAQVPFSGWLPRAMEGPTSSSAIFYGGLSIHVGAYLLLRTAPVLEQSAIAMSALVAIGLCSAVYGTLVGRVQTDAKNQLAYASLAQVGLILAEIGFGLRMLALLHVAGHALVRTLQLLKAPSLLNDHHQIHAAAGGSLKPTGLHFEMLLPRWLTRRLYAFAHHRGGLESLLDRAIVRPLLGFASIMDDLDRRFAAVFDRPAIEAERPLPAAAPSSEAPR